MDRWRNSGQGNVEMKLDWVKLGQTGQDSTGLHRTGSFWARLDWIGLDWVILGKTGLDQTGVDWTRLDWTGLDWVILFQSDQTMFQCFPERPAPPSEPRALPQRAPPPPGSSQSSSTSPFFTSIIP